jgi:hypothetical protein
MSIKIIKAERVMGRSISAFDVYVEENLGPCSKQWAIRIFGGGAYLFDAAPGTDLDDLVAADAISIKEA